MQNFHININHIVQSTWKNCI